MDDLRFVIPRKKYTEESSVISVRMPKDMIRKADELAKGSGRTRNEILLLCMEFALDHMDPANSATNTEH